MLQAVTRKRRRRRSGVVRVGRRDQHGLAAQPHRDPLLSRIERAGRVNTAGNCGAEHSLEEPGCLVRVGATADERDRNSIRASPISYPTLPNTGPFRPRMAVTSDFREPISLIKAD